MSRQTKKQEQLVERGHSTDEKHGPESASYEALDSPAVREGQDASYGALDEPSEDNYTLLSIGTSWMLC